ncbi:MULTISPECIES: putative porin [Chitinophagaceae]
MKVFRVITLILSLVGSLVWGIQAAAQAVGAESTNSSNVSYDAQGRPIRKSNQNSDTLKHRDGSEDSISISFRYYDSSHFHQMDSSINDFNKISPLPFTYSDLGNMGTPAHSLLFAPRMTTGWDAGFHSMDVFRYTLEGTRYFTSTRPYTNLGYEIGASSEQWIDVLHTQNRNSRVNFAIEFRLTNSPGAYKSQNTNNSNVRFNIASQSKNKRYSFNLIFINNSLNASANGGIVSDSSLISNGLSGLNSIATRLGGSGNASRSPFNTNISTGNKFSDRNIYFRHSFDFGQKDSIVGDSTTTMLFYPRLRIEHLLQYSGYNYQYIDANPVASDYLNYYQYLATNDTVKFQDKWSEFNNMLAIYMYPDKKNQWQYLKLDGGWQALQGNFGNGFHRNFNNIYVGAEYRNRTKNQKWELEALGKLYVTGTYVGDYSAFVSLKRNVANIGSLELGAQNVNRTPSFIFNTTTNSGNLSFDKSVSDTGSYTAKSNFPVITDGTNWGKENITKIFGRLYVPKLNLSLFGNYFFYTNYTYFNGFFNAAQSSGAFNVLQVGAEKETSLSKHFKWYLEAYVQTKAGNAPVNMPTILMRNRIAYEANFFKNLFLATGLEVRYFTPYKADNYSPFTGQFFYQNDIQVSNRPDVTYYLNFRITRFRFFGQVSNLNTMNYSKAQGFGFNKYSFYAPHYPGTGTWIRFGFKWMFIN